MNTVTVNRTVVGVQTARNISKRVPVSEKTKKDYRNRQGGGRQFTTCLLKFDHLARDRLLVVVFRRGWRTIFPASHCRLADKEKKKPKNNEFKSAGS